jgi:hypothetical protein
MKTNKIKQLWLNTADNYKLFDAQNGRNLGRIMFKIRNKNLLMNKKAQLRLMG